VTFFGAQALLQVMAGGSVYTPQWHFSLVYNNGDPWDDPINTWEVPGSRTPYLGGWQVSNLSTDYQGVVSTTASLDVLCPITASVRYIACFPNSYTDQWLFLNRVNPYPRSMSPGDYLRFPAGTITYQIYN
jgi:hypothetical protein